MDPMPDIRKLERDAFLSAVKSDLTRLCAVYVAALADAGADSPQAAIAEEAFRRGLASNRAIYERGCRLLEECTAGA